MVEMAKAGFELLNLGLKVECALNFFSFPQYTADESSNS
jgi:hypothetical protein